MPNIGPMELAMVLVVALLILGPKRLPQAGRSLGAGMREFKDGITGGKAADDEPAAVTAGAVTAAASSERV
jgi:sec-independent protein translocase protein TatA